MEGLSGSVTSETAWRVFSVKANTHEIVTLHDERVEAAKLGTSATRADGPPK